MQKGGRKGRRTNFGKSRGNLDDYFIVTTNSEDFLKVKSVTDF